ncbi:MAG TPA: hypothetical protein VEJ84_14950 [Acidimicrobiales bacterium]|nr:hypothetical protein [Acidimicrobiales bacterium]
MPTGAKRWRVVTDATSTVGGPAQLVFFQDGQVLDHQGRRPVKMGSSSSGPVGPGAYSSSQLLPVTAS